MTDTAVTMPDVDVDVPDADYYEERFRENEKRKYVHLVTFVPSHPGLHYMTACGAFMPYDARMERAGDTRCPECVEWEASHTH